LRPKLNKTSDVKVAYNDFIMRAVAMGLEKFPTMTGQLAGDPPPAQRNHPRRTETSEMAAATHAATGSHHLFGLVMMCN